MNNTIKITIATIALILTGTIVYAATRKRKQSDDEFVDNMPKVQGGGLPLDYGKPKGNGSMSDKPEQSKPQESKPEENKPASKVENKFTVDVSKLAGQWQPFGWVGGQNVDGKSMSGLHIYDGNNGKFKVGDFVEVKVLRGDKSYDGVHRIAKLGTDDDAKYPEYKNSMITIDFPKKGQADGVVRNTNLEFNPNDESFKSTINDLSEIKISANGIIYNE